MSSDISDELKSWIRPDSDALLLLLSDIVDDDLLMKIAVADYGHKADKCVHMLKQIRSMAAIPAPLDFNVREVWQLVRWSDPDDMARCEKVRGQRGHVMRAFACAVLTKAGGFRARRARAGFWFTPVSKCEWYCTL